MTPGLVGFLGLFLLVVVLVVPALHRDLERADARRRTREALAGIRGRFEGLQAAVGLALVPALSSAVQAAAEFAETMRQVEAAMRRAAHDLGLEQ